MTRLEDVMGRLAEKQEKLDDVLVLLVEAQIKTEARFQDTDQRFQETDAKLDKLIEAQSETDRRSRQTDERIDKLVSAIGELVRSRG